MATSTRNSRDPLARVERTATRAIDRELKRVDALKAKADEKHAARIAELNTERQRIEEMRNALGLNGTAPRGRRRTVRTA